MAAVGDLARCGRSVAVLERWPTINPSSRAFATMARTLEVLDARGLADGLLELGRPAPSVGLFGGARLDLTHLRSRYREDADGAWYRSMTWDRHHQVTDSEPVGDYEIIDVLNRALGRDAGVTGISWRSRFHCEERQVTRYRTGRVFLAGDAVHVHSPWAARAPAGYGTGWPRGCSRCRWCGMRWQAVSRKPSFVTSTTGRASAGGDPGCRRSIDGRNADRVAAPSGLGAGVRAA
jgi:2-polyprenyl-6-methoxyphenol hydroxylase-like FAD-dependent oxidoreductase